ncbi:ubiquitin carboxyl-terminal hydrolase 44-like isoform X2 [Corticium candelabrum]|uniref:ubiquitin carboxyl-terminal hydrolase 44-like isoform X2 n=1 Tax=Corticium candelabrum TaxID=121492 RepID=UPI002E276DFA|nr:ubiquitin carboxyl-terminal hydrolase 44-like isoform X2 [Corticium candelabrum]
MEHCPHVGNLRLDGNKTLLSPAHWSCSQCGTTESVWGCLLCSNVACGRDAGKHALDHFKQSNHPLAIEINKKYVHCYFCDAYVFNDNSHNELQLIRDTLNQLATQTYGEARTRSGRILRQASVNFAKDESRVVEESSKQADKLYTAECHCRISLLMRVFSAWQHYNKDHKCHSKSSTIAGKSTLMPPPLHLPSKMVKRRLAAGVTGLRNLGNTCYMNSALQALSHQTLFRECFRLLNVQQTVSCRRLYMRQTTMECFKEVTRPITKKKHQCRARYAQSGLKGGTEEDEESGNGREDQEVDSANREVSLCKALHAIFRVMWSGKWAMVTPHAVLSAVWSKISGFRGYSQQDTHEFLCELLCELQSELREFPDSAAVIFSEPMRNVVLPSEIISSSFEGQLMSAVVCHTCNTVSETIESFYDLSLDFPLNNSRESGDKHSTQPFSYNLTDLLQHFTMWETLDGCIYSCTYCNQKRRGSNSQFQCASKQLMLHKPPDVLRLHLKRFRLDIDWNNGMRQIVPRSVCMSRSPQLSMSVRIATSTPLMRHHI